MGCGWFYCGRCEADEHRKLMEEVTQARADSAFHQQVAEEARDAQHGARQQAQAAEAKLLQRVEDFAQEKAALENKLTLRGEQLARTTELRDGTKAELAGALKERDAALERLAAADKEAEALRERVAELDASLKRLGGEHEAVLRQRVPGASGTGALPAGFGSVTELVREATEAREEALSERQAKEQLQEVLQEVEREVRARYPALLSQKEEAERLRNVAARLAEQNEGLLGKARELEAAKREAEVRARKAERSEQILEVHARDIAKQLAILVHENRKLGSPAGVNSKGLSDLEQLEADRRAFRTVQDLAMQNEALRKSVARLTEECETAAQQELQAMREDQDKQVEEWKRHMAEKADQMKALVETVQRVTCERNELQKEAKSLKAEGEAGKAQSPAAAGGAAVPGRDATLREQLAGVREEFSKCTELLHKEARELRTSETKARQELAVAQGRLDFQQSRTGSLEEHDIQKKSPSHEA